MSKWILILIMAIFMSGCGVNTSGNISFDGEDLNYTKDSRTGLCFAYVASRKSFKASTSGLGLTCVPCEAIPENLFE